MLAIGIAGLLTWTQLSAEARQMNPELPAAVLEKAGLSFPLSASFLYFPQEQDSLQSQHCPTQGFYLDSTRTPAHERLSHSLRLSFKNKFPKLAECLRENSCSVLDAEQILNGTSKKASKFVLKGRAADYTVEINSHANLPAQELSCSSFALEVMKSQKLGIAIPASLWLLNYGNKLVFFNASNEKTWFSVNLPKQVNLAKSHRAAIDSQGNILVNSAKTSIVLSARNNLAIIKTESGIYRTIWGLGSAAYTEEWDWHPEETIAAAFNVKDMKNAFTLLSGLISGRKMMSWNDVSKVLKGQRYSSQELPGEVITVNEELGTHENTIYLATRENGESIMLSRFDVFQPKLTLLKDGLKADPRARNHHFIILDQDLYRFTADGLYKSSKQREEPTSLQGFKGYMKNEIQLFSGKVYTAKQCSLKIWSNRNDFYGLLKPQIKDISCQQGEGLGVSPWSFSATGTVSGRAIRATVSTVD